MGLESTIDGDLIAGSGVAGQPVLAVRTCPKPPSMPHPNRVREPGQVGRPRVYHEFLEVVRKRLRRHRKAKKPLSRRWNRLVGFEQEVLFLVMAGYPVNSIRRLFLDELPNLFTSLSHEGTAYSMAKVVQKAKMGNIYLDDLLQEVLSYYKAGPWDPSGQSWMKSQYLGPIYDSPESGMGSSFEENLSVKPVSSPVGNSNISPDPEPVGGFEEELSSMKRLVPGFELTPEEAFMGITGGGMKAVMAYRSLHKTTVSSFPEVVSSPAIAPVQESVSAIEFRSRYGLMREFLPDFSLSPDEIRVGLQDGFEAAMDLWEARQPGKAVVSEESVSAQNQISPLSPMEVFNKDYRAMQELLPELVLTSDELFVGVNDGFKAAMALWKARQSAGVVPFPVVKPVLEEVSVLVIDPVPETALSVVEEISPVVVPKEIVPEVAPVVSEEVPVEVLTEEKPVRIIRDGIPEMVNGYEKPLGYFMNVENWKARAKFSYSRGLDIIPLYDSELERQLMAHFLNDGVFPKSETLEDLAIEFPNGVVSKPGGIIPVPDTEVCYKNSGDLTLSFYIQQGVVPNFNNKFGRELFNELKRPGTSMFNWEAGPVKVQDVSGVFEKSPKYFSIDGAGTCVPVGEVGPGVGRFKMPDKTNYPAFSTYSVMSLVRQLPPQENMDLVPRNNEDLGNFMNDRDTLVTAHTALSCLIMEYETKMLPRLALRMVMERMIEAYYGLDTRTGWNGMLYYGDQLMPPVQPLRIETRRPPSWAIPEGWTWVTFCGLYPTEWLDRAKCLQCSGRVFRSELSLLLGRNLNYGSNGTTLPGLFLCPKGPTVEEEARLKGKGDVSGMWAMTLPERIFKCLESEISHNAYADDAHNYMNAFWKIVPVEDLVRLGADLNYKYQTGVRPKEGFLWDIPTSFDFKELGFKDVPLVTYCPPDSRQCGKFL